jgi:hypothetical protein
MATRIRIQDRRASSAVPGMGETDHPAAIKPPKGNAYENGDTSSWGEDVHPPPYGPGKVPAVPGAGEKDHPAAKTAAQKIAYAKARKALRLATYALGDDASDEVIEAQVMDFMNLPVPVLDDTLARCASTRRRASEEPEEGGEAEDHEESADGESAEAKAAHFTRLANFWSRKARKGGKLPRRASEGAEEEEMLAAMLAEAGSEGDAVDAVAEEMLAAMLAEEEAPEASDEDEALLAEMLKEEAAKKASKAPKGRKPARRASDEEAPEASDDEEAEALLAEMEKEEAAKKASRRRRAGEEAPAEEPAEEEETESEEPEGDDDDGAEEAEGSKKADDEMEDEADPMGFEGSDAGDDEDLEGLFAEDGEETPKAASKPARTASGAKPSRTPRLASVRSLGSVVRTPGEASAVAKLEALWPSAPKLEDL